jgi:hypothetical protein
MKIFEEGANHERMARVGMDSLKFHPDPPCPTLLRPAGRTNPEMAVRGSPPGVAHLQGRQPAAVFYPFGHPTPYANGANKQYFVQELPWAHSVRYPARVSEMSKYVDTMKRSDPTFNLF